MKLAKTVEASFKASESCQKLTKRPKPLEIGKTVGTCKDDQKSKKKLSKELTQNVKTSKTYDEMIDCNSQYN